jgi:hypothetical protein
MVIQFLIYDKDNDLVKIVEYENAFDLFRKDGRLKNAPSKMLLEFITSGKRAEIFIFDEGESTTRHLDNIT